jgi:hypothetical protein
VIEKLCKPTITRTSVHRNDSDAGSHDPLYGSSWMPTGSFLHPSLRFGRRWQARLLAGVGDDARAQTRLLDALRSR